MRDALTLHDLPAHHTYRLEVQITRWRWATHTSAATCHELMSAAYELHESWAIWRIVSNARDTITTVDPDAESWADAWMRAYVAATGVHNAWSAGANARGPWSEQEQAALADGMARGLEDEELCVLIPDRTLVAVRRRRQAIERSANRV